jgi:hypothetical protein
VIVFALAKAPPTYQRIVVIAVAVLVVVVVLELIRRRRLMERYALLWLIATVFLLAMAAWQRPLTALASAIGIYYFPSALFAAAFCFILVLLVHFSLTISRLSDQNKLLAQRLGLVQQRLERLGERAEEPERPLRSSELPRS